MSTAMNKDRPTAPGLTEENGTLHINPWHRAYCKWYDHHQAGHRVRAAIWGWIADRIVG